MYHNTTCEPVEYNDHKKYQKFVHIIVIFLYYIFLYLYGHPKILFYHKYNGEILLRTKILKD